MSAREGEFPQLPSALRERMLVTQVEGPFGSIPVLLAHPEPGWNTAGARPAAAPVCVWMHGRTANKELDPGRYLRWVRAGIATCAIDLPAHGERFDPISERPDSTLPVVEQMVLEIDHVVRALADPRFNAAFDPRRLAIGGMSAGGMATLRRLCDPHEFRCAAVEATTGSYAGMESKAFYRPELADRVEAVRQVTKWPRAIPLLALHSEKDAWVPIASMRDFLDRLSERYLALGADPTEIDLRTWPETGAPGEHIGFGKVSNEAKNIQTEFLTRCLAAG